MVNQYDEIMRELNAKNDEVASLNAHARGKDEAVFIAESRLRLEEAALHMESQQHEVAMSMAR